MSKNGVIAVWHYRQIWCLHLVSIMNEIEYFKSPKGMFDLVEATYQRYYRGASETDFLLLIFILNHLREQIVGGQKYNQIESINPQSRTHAQNLFMDLWELDEFQIIREICNGTKHHRIEKDLSQIEKTCAGIARSGDSLDQKYYLIDSVDSRNIFTTVLLKYKNYFNREKC